MIFRGKNLEGNTDIGQIGHLWMGTNFGFTFGALTLKSSDSWSGGASRGF
jgi:hypothetical protein